MNRSRGSRGGGRRFRGSAYGSLPESSDERLVELVLDGDDSAFAVLFERHVGDALWFAREALGSEEDAETAVRHSFAAAHAYLAARSPAIEFGPWLQTIVSNYCLSMLQARSRRRGEGEKAPVIDLDAWRRRSRRRLGALLPALPGARLRDGAMAALGVGGGATATGASLAGGGALAKLAVVAVLAGSIGVAGEVVSDRDVPAPAGVQVRERQPGADEEHPAAGAASSGAGQLERAVRRTTAIRDRPDSSAPVESDGRRHEGRVPARSAPAVVDRAPGGVPAAPLPSPKSDVAAVDAVAVPTPVRSALTSIGAAVETNVRPVTGVVSRVSQAADLPPIGDDPGVAPAELPIDVRALLRQGATAQPR